MTLDRLILDDFLTYDHLDYSFENKPLLVQGLNLTDDGQKTNGTGKSGLQTGIEQCITASNSRDVRDNEIITYGKKQARAQLYASCDIRKETIHIDWDIKLSGSNVLRLKIKKYGEEWDLTGDTQKVSFSNVNDGKKAIMDWFAISREDLFNYFIINNTRFKSFFKSSNTEKVALINRFSDASIINGIEKIDTTELDAQYKEAQSTFDKTSGKIALVTEQITTEKSRDFKNENLAESIKIDDEIADILEEIDSIKVNITLIKGTIATTNKSIDEANTEKSSLDTTRVRIVKDIDTTEILVKDISKQLVSAKKLVDDFKATDWKTTRDSYNGQINTIKESSKPIIAKKKVSEEQLTKISTLLGNIEIKLGGAITCPSCSHKFILDDDLESLEQNKVQVENLKLTVNKTLTSQEELLKDLEDNISKLQISLSDLNSKEGLELDEKNKLQTSLNAITKSSLELESKLRGFQQELVSLESKEKSRLARVEALKENLLSIDKKVENCEVEIKNYETEIANLNQKKSNLKVGNNKDLIKTLEKDLKGLEKTLESDRASQQKIGDKIYEMNQWALNFKQFRMYLANQSLEVIEYHCNRYLDEMKSDLIVKIEGFKVLADGSIKEEINATVVRDIERSFSSFSGGERGRLLFASILANRHMINETHPYGGLQFLAVDEVFEGVDSTGLQSLIESAKLLSIPVMIITHVSMDETNANVLTIVKENKISRIKI